MSKQNTLFKDAYNRSLIQLGGTQTLPSEPEMAASLQVSRTTVRAILQRLADEGLIAWDKRSKIVLRAPLADDYFPSAETHSTHDVVERGFMKRLMGADVGSQINELELARELGVGTSSVREFLIRFSRFGLIEKRPNSHWVIKGFTRGFALELADIREMFEVRSALAFVQLPKTETIWTGLDKIEVEHRALKASIDSDYGQFSELDERFHRLIHGSTDNRFIIEFYDIIAMVFHYHFQWNKKDEKKRNAAAIDEHLAYITALKSGDSIEAELTCRRHLRSARATLMASTPAT
ncbi:MAG: GntR family transcriptional regulator [Hyphomicrobiales bacterium]|nr:GntR family transcriptional regulator [Hyphomicrobiales bacterium]